VNTKELSTAQKAAIIMGASLLVTPVSSFIGYMTLKALDKRGLLGSKKPEDKPYTVADYNDAVATYNAAVAHFNQATEGVMEGVPKLKTLIDQVDQDAYNRAFEEIMREEF
jgi:hypothetical protein